MYSLLSAVWTWLAESANLLMDLADAGRVANNTTAIIIAATLAVIRIAALLILTVPAFLWLKNLIWVVEEHPRKGGVTEKTRVRTFVVVLLIASVAFEIWVSPARKANKAADNLSAVTVTQSKG